MSGVQKNKSALNRRKFVKSAVATTAAVGMFPVGQACAVIRDASGKPIEWVCLIQVIETGPTSWTYLAKNCTTGETWYHEDLPGLTLGNCASPVAGGCFKKKIWDRFEREIRDGQEYVISPRLADQRRQKK